LTRGLFVLFAEHSLKGESSRQSKYVTHKRANQATPLRVVTWKKGSVEGTSSFFEKGGRRVDFARFSVNTSSVVGRIFGSFHFGLLLRSSP